MLQTLFSQTESNRAGVEEGLQQLSGAVGLLGQQIGAEAGQVAALSRIAEGQERLITALTGPDGSGLVDAEQRMRLRSIDVQLLKILEEMSAGRQESLADLRADLSSLTAAIRQLSRSGSGRG